MGIRVAHIHAADLHRAVAHVPEAGNEARRSGLAAAGGPDQSHRLPRLHPEGNVIERGQRSTIIGKAHILEHHAVVLRSLRVVCDRQGRGTHDLVDAPQGGAGQHHAACREHDLGKRRGDNGGEDRVKGKVCHEERKITGLQSSRRNQQRRRYQEDERTLGEGQVHRLGHLADVRLVVLGLGAVILDSLFEGLEGIHSLLEDLYHRDAAHILGARLAHHILGRLVFGHEPCVFAAHHRAHGADGDHSREQAGRAHAPVVYEHQHQHGDEHGDCAHDIREVVGKQRLCLGGRAVQTVAQQAGGVGVEEAKRRLHQVFHACLADVARRAEGREVRAHQRGEIDQDPRKGEGKGHPAVAGDAGRLRPVGSHGDEVPGHQPDTNIRQHAQHHGDSRQAQAYKGQALMAARVSQ